MLWKFPRGCRACRAQACLRSDDTAVALLCCCFCFVPAGMGASPARSTLPSGQKHYGFHPERQRSVLPRRGRTREVTGVRALALRALLQAVYTVAAFVGRKKIRKSERTDMNLVGTETLLPLKPGVNVQTWRQTHARQTLQQQRSHQSEAVRQDTQTQTHTPHPAAAARLPNMHSLQCLPAPP